MTAEAAILDAVSAVDDALIELAKTLDDEARRLLDRLDREGGRLVSTRDNLASIAEIRRQIEAVATEQGLPRVMAVLDDKIPLIIQEALGSDYPVLGEFLPRIAQDVERALAGVVDDVARQMASGVADDLAKAVRLSITSGADVSKLATSIGQQMDASLGRVATLIERSIREVTEVSLKAAGEEAGKELGLAMGYVYIGPDDGKTRDPYCKDRLDKVLTQAQADALDPSERYNCRHGLAPIVYEDAIEQGIKPYEG